MNIEDIKEIEETDIWSLYKESENFLQRRGIYNDTDKNFRMYNGDQWDGVKVGDMEKIQYNIIKRIVKQKVTTITQSLFAINYSPENVTNSEFTDIATKTTDLLNTLANKTWDKDSMDSKVKRWSKQSAINGEAICYVDFNTDTNLPINEIINKNDIMYGNENEPEIELQPYILIRQRRSVSNLQELARSKGVSENDIRMIVGDDDTLNVTGAAGKDELNKNAWLITKLYKKNGEVIASQSTRFVNIYENKGSGLSRYPIAHWNWEDVEGDSRGVGEVKYIIPNQLEINKTAMRRAIVCKLMSYPQRVINSNAIRNKKDVGKIGAVIEFQDLGNTKASDVFMTTQPASMSSDSEKLQLELINTTSDLAGAGDAATGSINPEAASGTAILAVQNAQNAPLNDQLMGLKQFLEDIARIWFDMWKTYPTDSLTIEVESVDDMGNTTYTQEKIPTTVMEQLQTNVKVDITPRGSYDKYAQELSIQNLLSSGIISLEEYTESLDTDSVMPKIKLENIIKSRKEKQKQIDAISQQAAMLEQQAGMSLATQSDINSIDEQGQQLIRQ